MDKWSAILLSIVIISIAGCTSVESVATYKQKVEIHKIDAEHDLIKKP